MNGAKSLVETLLQSGVDTCFANPGTSEMHFVAALDQSPGMRCYLGLQENVVTGMADGYYRIAGKPACTLLHCGPGFSNGMANLHDARRARSGIVNIVGDQATYHRWYDAPLTSDVDAIARTVSQWVRMSTATPLLGADAAEAVRAARTGPGQVATLIVPSDISWSEGGVVAPALAVPELVALDAIAVDNAARALRNGRNTLILLSGKGGTRQAQKLAWRVSQATGAKIMLEYCAPTVERGEGSLPLAKVPYAMSLAIEALREFDQIVLVNAKAPVGFFGYPDMPSIQHRPDADIHVLARPEQDAVAALTALVEALGAPDVPLPPGPARAAAASGAPTSDKVAQTVAALMPEGTIIADESISYGRGFYRCSHASPAHTWLHQVGGAIGGGLPMATGAAIGGKSERRVISLQADGSGMYTVHALWTQARENLPVTTILLNNRKYNILIGEYQNVGAVPGATAMSMLDLGKPDLDWVSLANGLGVEAARAHTMEECATLMEASFKEAKPFLIELMI
ncbi:acetolactate synthase large subunit [Xanthobacter variabilis]|uniref:acetolactate synthase large subunit n=1 Tax=Xanthobacter variabilis TaxID=3119932 RepID=UPI003726EAC4